MLTVEVITPEKIVFSSKAEIAVVPGVEGDFGVLVGHAPFISLVRPGVMSIAQNDGAEAKLFVSGGVAEVTSERCVVLAEEALDIANLSKTAVEERLQKARSAFEKQPTPEAEKELSVAEALKALAA